MMKFFADFFPIVLFFGIYKFFGIYAATAVAIGASVVQVAWQWWRHRQLELMQILTLLIIIVFGSATLYLHNEWFIKWKPTVINWVMALVFAGSNWIKRKPLIQTLMPDTIPLTTKQWQQLNLSWVIFFIFSGFANLYVIYNFNTNAWVNFKLFGMMGLTLFFVILQAIYLRRCLTRDY